jgi:gentisate 1,2-dioxygenase
MDTLSREDLAAAPTLEHLYGALDNLGIGAGWNKPTPSLWAEPTTSFVPVHWSYEQAHGALEAAGRLINTELAERRNLILFNPAPGNTYATVRTLITAYQMIMPGEWARVHRHTPNALRLILDAEPGTYTEVDGLNIPMDPGDVVLTPNWSNHGHGNNSKAPAYWLDFLDVPLVHLLEPMFFEPHDKQPPGTEPAQPDPAKLVFPYAETLSRLDSAKPEPEGPFATQIALGDPAMRTIALHMMRLAPRKKTAPFRTTENNIYAVVRGTGATVVDAQRFEWSRGDVIAAPAWKVQHHEAADDAILFRVSDEPVMRTLGFHRHELV